MPESRLAQLLRVMLLAFGLLVFAGTGHAEAEDMLASWYGPGFDGRPTASGEIYDADGYTAAHKTLPFGMDLVVSYEGDSVPVEITDRGPYVGKRELDLSQGAAKELGMIQPGVDHVEVGCVYGSYPNCSEGTYVVQPGDTFSEIAARSGFSAEYLASFNRIADPNTIYSGQKLYIPAGEGVGGGTPALPQGTAQKSEPSQAGASNPSIGNTDGKIYGASYPNYSGSDTPSQGVGTSEAAYVVQPGDTLSGIAAQLGVSAGSLAAHNGITDPNLIYGGQTLYY